MSGQPDVVLITTDARLREIVRRCRPPDLALRCVSPDKFAGGSGVGTSELWVDLDGASGLDLPPAGRRVYFHSSKCSPPKKLPSGLFIRKPCSETVAQVLWSSVTAREPAAASVTGPVSAAELPAWIMEFQELGLRELCRTCVTRLPARLGYADASLYLYDELSGVLTLAEATHGRGIDMAVPMADERTHLMVSVARGGRLLRTDEASREREARGLRRAVTRRYADGACLIAPLVDAGRLWGVLNLSRAEGTLATQADLPLAALFTFIGRSLHFASAYDQARTEARVDVLTGLYNQRWIVEALAKEIRRSQRFGIPMALIIADVDGLKPVNDGVGHSAGDCLLRHVASRITSALRQFDSAARVGGDEFVLLLPATDLEGARQVARRVLEAIRSDPAVYRGVSLPVRASLGVVQWRAGWDAARLIEAADRAMYLAKQRGRDQLACHPRDAPVPLHFPTELSQRLWCHPAAIPGAEAEPMATPARMPAPADQIAGV